MNLRDYMKENSSTIETPAYYFDIDVFRKRVEKVCGELPNIPLTFSIKANPFLLSMLPENIRHVEVCSPGELKICREYGIPGDRIIYSGVNKEKWDVAEAVGYGVDIATAESIYHAEILQEEAAKLGKYIKVILRLTSGNQFGMSQEDIFSVISNSVWYPNLDFYGIHYYSGTQKKTRQVQKDLQRLGEFLEMACEKYGFIPRIVEMGPGLSVDYFNCPYDEEDENVIKESAPLLNEFAGKYPLGIEMGRFLAAPCGTYATKVMDVKYSCETNYVICDGGIHQLRYHGQTMAMQVPEIEVLLEEQSEMKPYCICGSLCTVADVLVREVSLPRLERDNVILFHRCGAYSVMEGSAMFLSRQIPAVYVYGEDIGLKKLRPCISVADMCVLHNISKG
jgi:diaminopimelate decarboxylase